MQTVCNSRVSRPLNLISAEHSKSISSSNSKTQRFVKDLIHSKSDFNFKFVSKTELETILKRVRREKQKQQDEANWNNFVKSRLEKNADETAVKSSTHLYFANEIPSCAKCGIVPPSESNVFQSSRHQEIDDFNDSSDIEENVMPGTAISSPNLRSAPVDANLSHNYQLGPGLKKRLEDLLATVGRMTTVLLSPCLRFQHEEEDVDRAIKRCVEFDAMFSRNHLYEIQRLLKDTKQMMTAKCTPAAELENKISATLKAVSQALQVYTRHVSKGSRVKYQQVVPIFQSIAIIQSMIESLSGQRLFPMRQDLDVSCSYLKQILLEISATETRSVTTVSNKASKVRLRHKPSTDLSMYSRRQKEWHRKSATLARARFGPPSSKKQYKKPQTAIPKQTCRDHKDHISSERDAAGSQVSSKVSLVSSKQPASSKEPFRNATRAVSEEHVKTMMEMIPQEPPESSDLYIDDNTFQALKLLSRGCQPAGEETFVNFEEPEDCGVQEQLVKTAMKVKENTCIETQKSPKEITNVQLVYVREGLHSSSTQRDSKQLEQPVEDELKTLTTNEYDKVQSLEYKQKITNYQQMNPLYKDDKALGIVDRLASLIFKEIIIDFQRNEMDQVVQTLYNLEFE